MFYENPSNGQLAVSCGRTDRHTGREKDRERKTNTLDESNCRFSAVLPMCLKTNTRNWRLFSVIDICHKSIFVQHSLLVYIWQRRVTQKKNTYNTHSWVSTAKYSREKVVILRHTYKSYLFFWFIIPSVKCVMEITECSFFYNYTRYFMMLIISWLSKD
jgi:hypothetical protein